MKDEDWILNIVHSFYNKAKIDILIGYHFRNIKDFEEHIPRIAAFWELQLLGRTKRSYSEPFDVMKVHLPLGIKRGELGRWLLLFRKTLAESPEHELKAAWENKLTFFEDKFLRFFGF